MTDLIRITVNRDHVLIEGSIVLRPDHIGVEEWREFWENARDNNSGKYEEGWDDGYQACVRDNDERSSFK